MTASQKSRTGMKATLFALGLGILGLATPANAAMKRGDVIAIDFGGTATAEANWNTRIMSSTTDLVRLSDGGNTDVDLTITSVGGTPANWANFLDGSAQGGSSVFEIYDDGVILAGSGDDQIITGLSVLAAANARDNSDLRITPVRGRPVSQSSRSCQEPSERHEMRLVVVTPSRCS